MTVNERRSRFVMTNGFRTHYTESGGDGPVVVALHGGGAGSSGAAGMDALMQRLSPDIRVIAIDSVGGFGLTDVNAPSPHGILSRAEHVGAVADALCLDRFVILGNSQGAWAASRYAISNPDRIQSMILIGTSTVAMAMDIKVEKNAAMLALQGYDGTREGMRKLLQAIVYDKSIITENLIDLRYAAATRPGAMEAFKTAVKGNERLRTDPLMRAIFFLGDSLPAFTKSIPTTFIWGENDEFAIPELGRQIEAKLPDATFEWVAQAGHQVQNDQPEICAKIVENFVRRTAPVSVDR